MFNADLAYMSAFAALHGNEQADIEKGSQQTNVMYYNAVARIPFLTGGKSGQSALEADRQALIDAFNEERKLSVKNATG